MDISSFHFSFPQNWQEKQQFILEVADFWKVIGYPSVPGIQRICSRSLEGDNSLYVHGFLEATFQRLNTYLRLLALTFIVKSDF